MHNFNLKTGIQIIVLVLSIILLIQFNKIIWLKLLKKYFGYLVIQAPFPFITCIHIYIIVGGLIRTKLVQQSTGRVRDDCKIRRGLPMIAAVAVVFNFTIKCHL